MEKTNAQKFKLGIFVILGTFLLVIAAYYIGNRQNLFGDTFQVNAVFRDLNGLQKGNNVRFAGINIGTVSSIEMINDTTIKVGLLIDKEMKAHIRKNAIASLGTDGLVGSMIVNITPGKKENAASIEAGDELKTYSRIASDDLLNTLNVTNENAALLTADLLDITQAVIHGKGTLGRLLNDTGMARDLYTTIANLKDISTEVNNVMTNVNGLLHEVDLKNSAAGVLLNDTASGKKVKRTIVNLQKTSSELKTLSMELNAFMQQLKEAEGTVNYLTTDTSLVKTLHNTMQSIEEGSKRFNENMEALQHNFLLRGYFKRQEKERANADTE